MITLLLHLLRLLPFLCGGRRQLALENLALRQQLAVYKRTMPRPKLRTIDRVFWVGLSQSLDRLETGSGLRVTRHRLAMAAASLPRVLDPALRSADRRPTMRSAEIVALVRRMAAANPLWGAPHSW
jgi:putative transposase